MTEAPERIVTSQFGKTLVHDGMKRFETDVEYIRKDVSDALIAAAYVDAANLHQSLWRETSAYKTDQILKRTPADARAALDRVRQEAREEALREALAECDSVDPTHARILALITKDQTNG